MERGNGRRRGRARPSGRSAGLEPAEGEESYRAYREQRRNRHNSARIREEAEKDAFEARRRSFEKESAEYTPLDDNMSDIAEERGFGRISASSGSPSSGSPLLPSPLAAEELAERMERMGPAGGIAIEGSRYQATRDGSSSGRLHRMPRSPFAAGSSDESSADKSRLPSRPVSQGRSRFSGLAEQETATARQAAAHLVDKQAKRRERPARTRDPSTTLPPPIPVPGRQGPTDVLAHISAPIPARAPTPEVAAGAAADPSRPSLFRKKSHEAPEPREGASKAITGILKLPKFRRSRSGGDTSPPATARSHTFRGVRFGFLTSNRQPGDSSSSSSGWSRQTQPPSMARSGGSIPANPSQQSRSSSGSLHTPSTSPRDDDAGPTYLQRQEQVIQQYEERQRAGSGELQRAATAQIHAVRAAAREERDIELQRNEEREEQRLAAKQDEKHIVQAREMQRQVEAERKARDDAEAPARQKRRGEEKERLHRECMVAELERRQKQRELEWERERARERERVRRQEAQAEKEADEKEKREERERADALKIEEVRRELTLRQRGRRERPPGKGSRG